MPEPENHRDEAMEPAGGTGATMDFAQSEARTLERAPQGEPVPGGGPAERPRSLWSDAWRDLRRNPVFILSALVILFLVVISVWPQLIATGNPLSCNLDNSQKGSAPGHPFGFDNQGCDVYTRVVYGARASVTVGVCATLGAAVLGGVLGGLAGFYGGWGTRSCPGSATSSSASRSCWAAWCSCR